MQTRTMTFTNAPGSARLRAGAIALCMTGFSAAAALADDTPHFTMLEGLTGNTTSLARGVSEDGNVIVGRSGSPVRAVLWTEDHGFTNLGVLPGHETFQFAHSEATAVSADGSVVVGWSSSSSGLLPARPFRWTKDEGMVSLGTLPMPPYITGAWANGVSADGSVVVGGVVPSFNSVPPHAPYPAAFRWTHETGMVPLEYPPELPFMEAFGVSGDGQVIVGSARAGCGGPTCGGQAFRWAEDDGTMLLGTLPGLTRSEARAANADGSVIVGRSWTSSTGSRAFRWTLDGGMVDLGTLDGYPNAEPFAVTPDGEVVVGRCFGAGLPERAFRWTIEGGMQDLVGDLPGEDPSPSIAYGVSADGALVVGRFGVGLSESGLPSMRAFRWTEEGGKENLGTLLQSHFATADAVSADGRIVVGRSGSNFDYRATLWNEERKPIGLGTLPGQATSFANGVSGDGSVVVGHSGSRAYRWTSETGMEDLGTLFGHSRATAYAASDDGSVIVGSSSSDPWGGDMRAVRWTENDMVDLGPGIAHGVSADGSVVVGYSWVQVGKEPYDVSQIAFRWTQDEGMVLLGTLPNYESSSSAAAVSANGSFVVGDSYRVECQGWDCWSIGALFRWNADAGMSKLSAPEFNWSWVAAVNDDGIVAGANTDNLGWSYATVWTANNARVNLNEHLVDLGVDLDGWVLRWARGMSQDGRTFAGAATRGNTFTNWAWVATIPAVPVLCPADFTGNGSVGVPDLLALLACWGPVDPAPGNECAAADLTASGGVGVPDLLALLSQWGPCPR